MAEQVEVKLPNHMTYVEIVNSGKSPEQAKQIMHERVYGAGVKFTDAGQPVQTGRGAPGNETAEHHEALALALERKAQMNPNSADVIAAAVAAGVKAGLQAAKDGEKF